MNKNKKSSIDENQIASSIINQISKSSTPTKNPAAVALGKMGGLKGGPARAKKLSPAKRKQIAIKAAKTRWSSIK